MMRSWDISGWAGRAAAVGEAGSSSAARTGARGGRGQRPQVNSPTEQFKCSFLAVAVRRADY